MIVFIDTDLAARLGIREDGEQCQVHISARDGAVLFEKMEDVDIPSEG